METKVVIFTSFNLPIKRTTDRKPQFLRLNVLFINFPNTRTYGMVIVHYITVY
jgi:hypothetical protein